MVEIQLYLVHLSHISHSKCDRIFNLEVDGINQTKETFMIQKKSSHMSKERPALNTKKVKKRGQFARIF